jgi:NADH-quinone oxidoreductase subunit C
LLPEDWEGFPLRKDYEVADYYHGVPIPKDKSYWE